MPFIVLHEMPPLRLTKFFTLTFCFPKINFNIILLSVSGLPLLGIFRSNFRPLFSFLFLYVIMESPRREQTELKIHRILALLY